ncbi:YggT family protein [Xanthomonadaceae bacterium XH05]|nr:YggT family protein [Xanthomonadaceae bacterium XH05]
MPYLTDAGTLLVDVLFGLMALGFVLRVLLQWVGAPFHNPICQGIYRLTNPVLMPLRRALKPWRRIDTAGVVVSFLILALKALLLLALWRLPLQPAAVLVLALAEMLGLLLTFYFWLVLIRVILSWAGNGGGHPAVPLLMQLTEPLLRPVRRALPALGGFDLSPLLVSLSLMLARILLVAPLRDLAILLATR